MKHVKGDMDDLFRRASERYPLRTDSAAWDRLAADLDHDPGAPSDIEAVDKRRRRDIFWWLLLLPLGGLGYLTWQATAHPTTRLITPAVQVGGAAAKAGVAQVNSVRGGGTAAQAGGVKADDAKIGALPADHAQAGEADGQAGHAAAGAMAVKSAGNRRAGPGASQRGGTAARASVAVGSGSVGSGSVGSVVARLDRIRRGGARLRGERSNAAKSTDSEVTQVGLTKTRGSSAKTSSSENTAGNTTGNATGDPVRPLYLSALDLRTVPTAGNYNLMVNVKVPVTQADNADKTPKKAMANTKTGHAYIGIMGAPDFSTVKLQTMKGVGNTFGILLGYAFNDRWAVESGVYLDQKKYYSDAEYFSKEGYTAYPGNPLLNVNGTCKMLEIPLNLRYNFSKNQKMRWFATAGFSTYLMFNENYTGNYVNTGSGYVWPKKWEITKPSQYWFSVVNISGGFEQRIGKIGNLRIEPYLRLPLSGIGTGRLPIMSGGLNIGITHQLW